MKVVDMHCDTISEIVNQRRRGEECCLRKNGLQADLERMRAGGYTLQNFALFVNVKKCAATPWDEVCALWETYRDEIGANADLIAPVHSYADIAKNEREGRMSAMLTVEEGAVCQGETEKLDRLYEMGVRMLTLTWNYPNGIGYPARNLEKDQSHDASGRRAPDAGGGLTEFGREFVRRMEELGMIVDVSHLSDAGFYDVMQYTKKPFAASHSNAREICGCARNLTDDMIRKLAGRGGCMGLNFCMDFLETDHKAAKGACMMEAAIRHARHIVKVGGEEVLGLGSDFDGIDVNPELPGAQSMEKLWNALHGAGFTPRQLDLIFEGNVMRLYKEILS